MIAKLIEIYKHRELLVVFTKKELKVKYKNSAMGVLWSFINPLIMAVVYTLVFSKLFGASKEIKDYPIFLLSALLAWNFFTVCIATSSSAIIANANLIKKVRFPREIIPLSIILAALANYLMEVAVLMVILLIMGYNFIPYLPIFLLVLILQLIATAGFGFIFSALTVYFRDIEQLINIILLIWFFATPIVYDISKVNKLSPIFATALKILNPLVSIMLLYRSSLYYLSWPSLQLIIYGLLGSTSIFIAGYILFQKLSPNFAKEV
ncbi:MAG: ABC transporter permease [Actinobacteria bacterium]|nr:MAG: ABC transporter permease [Actinomycetota bacterium]